MRIDIITACPELLESPLNHSIIQRAKDKGLCEIYVQNLRDWTLDKHRKVDDYAFGFGAGMVLQVEPIDRLITHLKSERETTVCWKMPCSAWRRSRPAIPSSAIWRT